ncbi:hypothetical protein D3C84_847990 [compost metagenome]
MQRELVLNQIDVTASDVVDPVVTSSCTGDDVVLLKWITAITTNEYESLGILLLATPDDVFHIPLGSGHILTGNPFHHILIEYRCSLAV